MKLLTRRFRHITASSKLCSLHFWSPATLDIFPKNIPDTAELLEPLERAINEVLIPAVTDHTVTKESATALVSLCAREALDLQLL